MFANAEENLHPYRRPSEYIDYAINGCLFFYLIIDSITGFLLKTGAGPGISAPYKTFLLFLMVTSIIMKSSKLLISFSGALFLAQVYLVLYCLDSNVALNQSIATLIKTVTVVIYFIYFYCLLKVNSTYKNKLLNRFFKINCTVFLSNIALGILGFGFYTYPALKVGVKGFFYAGNEVSVLLFCLYYIFLTRLKFNNAKILLVYAIGIGISLLIITKTVVLSCILISCVDYYFRSTRKSYIILFAPVILVILISLGMHFLPQTQFYQKAESTIQFSINNRGYSLSDAVLSGRVGFLKNNYKVWEEHFSPAVFLFGLGHGTIMPRIVEIDVMDTFFYYGIIITVFKLLFYFYLVFQSIYIKNYHLFFFNLIYLFISFTAGHVWYGAMAGLFYAYINAYELRHYQVKKKKGLVYNGTK